MVQYVLEPPKLRYKEWVPYVLHAIRRVAAKANIQQQDSRDATTRMPRSRSTAVCAHYSCVYTHTAAATKIRFSYFPLLHSWSVSKPQPHVAFVRS